MSPINPEGWQAHSEGGVGQIRIAIGYLFGSLQPDPGSASIPHHYQGAQEQGMQLERWDGPHHSQCEEPQRMWGLCHGSRASSKNTVHLQLVKQSTSYQLLLNPRDAISHVLAH